ncbi:MAG TPA: hypothetical protein VFB92_24830 [Vicinamibacterales bacterium]|nr:hypothetical protein [Vicinamibacterales bacterium]
MRQTAILALALAVLSSLPAKAQGQPETVGPVLRQTRLAQEQRGQSAQPTDADSNRGPDAPAEAVRNQLQQMLWQLPPAVRGVLQYDPTLIDRPGYLDPYPSLQAFLKRHPEISRNPTYFFGNADNRRGPNPLEAFAAILAGTGLFIAFMTLLVLVGSVASQVVDYRRWVRQTRMQIDVHSKILDRMQSNEDLLAYVQTPAGRNFLEFAPGSTRPEPRFPGAPFGRILWSVQAGVVLAAFGIGLRYAQGTVPEEIMPAFTVLAIIVMSLGIGAVISAVVAYFLSSRLGLLPSRRQETNA